ncbi:MAG: YceI family protein [Saprospiraceae bacterium]|jgi:polyisoprenoid-binding protein YceI|nr:YceI family protein [Saprospiraceae bacterium]
MKEIHSVILSFIVACCFISCKNGIEQNKEIPIQDSTVIIQTQTPIDTTVDKEVGLDTVSGTFNIEAPSTINWTASDPSSTHIGTVDISSGTIEIKNGKILNGNFIINMKSIHSTDLSVDDGKERLEKHLSSADFFNVQSHPEAKVTIKKSILIKANDKTRHHIIADLTIKNITKPIEFDAFIIASNNGKLLTATTPSFEINRILYDIKFRSGLLNTVKDKIISDKIGIVVNLRAKK